MAMLWLFTFLGDRQGWVERDHVLAALSTSLAAMLVFVLYVASGREALIISALAWQGLIAMLGLCMAATDIAELAVVAVESATAQLSMLRNHLWAALAFALLAILATTLLTLTTTDWSARAVAQDIGGATGVSLWLGLTYWMVIARRKRLGAVHAHIDYRTLLLIVGFYFVALQGGIMWRLLEDPKTYHPRELFTYPAVFTFTTLGLLAFVVLFFVLGTRSSAILVALAYGVTVGMFIFHYYASHGSNIVLIVTAVAMGSLLYLLFAPLSRKLRHHYGEVCLIVADLNLAFVAYALIAALFLSMGSRRDTEALSVGQAMIVLAALAWDIVSSGEAITNRHTETFPRLSRVAMFIAYIISVALMVMVSSAGHLVSPANGEAIEGVFESEPLVGLGLILFGAPFIFVMAALRVRNLLAQADARVLQPPTAQTERQANAPSLA
jgi:hypothetical protein